MVWRLDDGAMERFVANELEFWERGSSGSVRCSGMVKRKSFFIILDDIPLLNSRTCLRMYFRNASDDHRPMSIIMKTGVSSMNIAMAAAERVECVPMSSAAKPSLSFPMLLAHDRKDFRRSFWVNSISLPLCMYVHIEVSDDVPG